MPQMAPMWWLTLYMGTLTSIMWMMTMIYFNSNPKKNKIKKTKKASMKWKW
uniref:ATP synthase F0 subunit 8 n=1 Tax=Kalasha nativa TaxID=2800228 RepID=A0A7T6YCS8_9HEMI|nr:ATP synthase F0 subunit 8 [Kalasha nativa]QQK57715.1 ATP synthase F0 subunit 8 [Kalasha nativa]